MNIIRAISIGILIWILGVVLFTLSSTFNFIENPELQANVILFIGLMPIVWLGSKLYYRKINGGKGYWLGIIFFSIATGLDAVFTVPLFILPQGGTYYEFFTALAFWLIGFEIITITTLYWYINTIKKNNNL